MTKKATRANQGGFRRHRRGFRYVPFGILPSPFGPGVPSDLGAFEARADEAQYSGRRILRPARVRHEHTRPARQDTWLERQ